ncbi:MAG: lipase [Proteobacteria bacterium]|nr:lipase [Pseudomonadota bacterium]HQR02983.1 lipase family protein [Rhodocyclaceae bacterium]
MRSEVLEPKLRLENAAESIRLLYSSEGFNGRPVTVSGQAFLPRGTAPKGGWPVLAWSHGTVGIADVCAPSFRGNSARDITYLNKWLAAGYAIVATDYEGLGTPGTHAYLHCRSEANGNVDAVRAAQQLGWPLSKNWLVFGQSQGGQGALCTGAIATKRAPELNFLGTLATAPGLNFMDRFSVMNPADPNPFIVVTLLMARGFETFEPDFKSSNVFTDAAMALMPVANSECIETMINRGVAAKLTVGESFKLFPLSAAPGVAAAARQMEIPRDGWDRPVFIGQGMADEMVSYPATVDFGVDLCARGVTTSIKRYPGARHSGPIEQGFDDFRTWVDARFAGLPATDNCAEIRTWQAGK